MPKKPPTDTAGRVTSVVDPIRLFQGDKHRLKALESLHETETVIATTHAWTAVVRLAILACVVGVVLVCAMALGVPPPWELALSILFGRSSVH